MTSSLAEKLRSGFPNLTKSEKAPYETAASIAESTGVNRRDPHAAARLARRAVEAQTETSAGGIRRTRNRSLDFGRSLRRDQRGGLSREPPHPRSLASRPPTRRPALSADLPSGRTRSGGRRPHTPRAAHGQSAAGCAGNRGAFGGSGKQRSSTVTSTTASSAARRRCNSRWARAWPSDRQGGPLHPERCTGLSGASSGSVEQMAWK
jgi:hypothetical protein